MKKNNLKTTERQPVKDWLNYHWPKKAEDAILHHVSDYKKKFIFRTSETEITISSPIESSFQIVLDYHCSKNCYLAYNSAIQNSIRQRKKKRIRIGNNVSERLSQPIDPDSISFVYQDINGDGANQVELVLVIGENAIEKFCKSYKELIIPDASQIPKGKTCIYADAGGEIQRIRSTQE